MDVNATLDRQLTHMAWANTEMFSVLVALPEAAYAYASPGSEWGAPPPDVIIKHTNMYWGFQSAPGRTSKAVTTAEVSFSA